MNKRDMAKLCRKAVKVIQTQGWWQGGFGGYMGSPCCIAGALGVASTENGEFPGGSVSASTAQSIFGSVVELYKWNDAPGRTKEEVISRLRERAFQLEHGGKTYAEYTAARKARSTSEAANV